MSENLNLPLAAIRYTPETPVETLFSQAVRALQARGVRVGGVGADAVLAAAGWPDAVHPVLIVGHQPTLGQVAARLLAGVDGDVSVKKAGVWWFQCRWRSDKLQVVLRAVAGPDYA